MFGRRTIPQRADAVADGAAEVKAKLAQVDLAARFLAHTMETLHGDSYRIEIDPRHWLRLGSGGECLAAEIDGLLIDTLRTRLGCLGGPAIPCAEQYT
ncbi:MULTISPECIES: hypothetical protein [unclassified Mesorhizobium]|uniref:hypothetical protein n=1 Tax=unclassified Mesorhizobium TaxID=325217 RepID=UPI000FCB1ED1|nr:MULTISPECIES: hypothetical protein [unclassified Mesorhizobium]TIO89452.1 MAG: hypothetical protein E5Y00_01890 [Mesorhizobium sp.]TIS06001.1 MAG: hypothetical protein E5X14_18290 [Mesorhizobium sp.]